MTKDTHPETASNLIPCPFCQSSGAPRLGDNVELGIHPDTEFYGYTVYCSASPQNGGCGANCGFCESKEEALERWNRNGISARPNVTLMAPEAIECLKEFVFHYQDFRSACGTRASVEANRNGNDAEVYWQKQQDLLDHMQDQALQALSQMGEQIELPIRPNNPIDIRFPSAEQLMQACSTSPLKLVKSSIARTGDQQHMSHAEMLDLCAKNPALASGLPLEAANASAKIGDRGVEPARQWPTFGQFMFVYDLAEKYLSDPVSVARLCDKEIDRSGGLLGLVRMIARFKPREAADQQVSAPSQPSEE